MIELSTSASIAPYGGDALCGEHLAKVDFAKTISVDYVAPTGSFVTQNSGAFSSSPPVVTQPDSVHQKMLKDRFVLIPAGPAVRKLPVGEISERDELRRNAIFSIGGFREKRATAGIGQEETLACGR